MRQEQLGKLNEAVLVILARERAVDPMQAQPAILVHRQADGVDAPPRHALHHGQVRGAREHGDIVDARILAPHHRHPFQMDGLPCAPIDQLVADAMQIRRLGRCAREQSPHHRQEHHGAASTDQPAPSVADGKAAPAPAGRGEHRPLPHPQPPVESGRQTTDTDRATTPHTHTRTHARKS